MGVIQQYVEDYEKLANKVCKGTKVFPLVVLAISGVESKYGTSELAKQGNNFFGIMKHDWKGETIQMKGRTWRKYKTVEQSFEDFVKFLYNNSRYKTALKASNASQQIRDLAAAGYAEEPYYDDLILTVAAQMQLYTTVYVVSKKPKSGFNFLAAAVSATMLIKALKKKRSK